MSKQEKNIAVFDCFSGISGNMTIGAFLDMGMDANHLKRQIKKLKLSGYELIKKRVNYAGFKGTHFVVRQGSHSGRSRHVHERLLRDILRLIDKSSLNNNVKILSKKIFETLAAAEAKVHGVKPESVHFHEVGAIDSILDVVGTAICFDYYNIEQAFIRSICVGSGVISGTRHGTLPIPSPATALLLKKYPVIVTTIPHELVTPTGAAIIRTLCKPLTSISHFSSNSVGYGAGTKRFIDRANMVRITLGTAEAVTATEDDCVILETNIDDMQPVYYEHVFNRLFAAGARDVFITPIIMKKTRPAHMLSVICDRSLEQRIASVIFQETTTIGIRIFDVRRRTLPRSQKSVKTKWGIVQTKVITLPDKTKRVVPEYESCKQLAERHNLSLSDVYKRLC